MLRIINIVGARPNFMKMAPLMAAMQAQEQIAPLLVHTGQHYDNNLSKVFFDELNIPRPDIDLGIGSGTRDEQISAIQDAFRETLKTHPSDAVLVVGDVNSTIACATVAREQGLPIIHVEAGLRSFDPDMPEEINRRETDAISDLLFVTEESGMRNLNSEANTGQRFLVGNVMIDTLVDNLQRSSKSPILEHLGLRERTYAAATFHRPSNVDALEDLAKLLDTIEEICRLLTLVLPVHPRTRQSLIQHRLLERIQHIENLVLCEPLGYLDFLKLISASRCVVTDSGGIQEETTWLGIPCLTMRQNTERPCTVDIGTNVLVGSDQALLMSQLDAIVSGSFKQGAIPDFWDGHTAQRIVQIICESLAK